MKSIKMFTLVLAITFSSTLFANTNPTHGVSNELTKEISTLLKNPKFTVVNDLVANVSFMLNKNKEVVVISIDTVSEELERYIKNRLNYSKLNLELMTVNKAYKIPVRITAE